MTMTSHEANSAEMMRKTKKGQTLTSRNIFRQLDESEHTEKVKLFSDRDRSLMVFMAGSLSAVGVITGSALTVIFGTVPLFEALAIDAGLATMVTTAVLAVEKKITFRELASKFTFGGASPKAKMLLPGQTHVQQADTIYINEQQESRSYGLYAKTSHHQTSVNSTHEVETSIVQKWNGSSLVQKVTPLPAYAWTAALESTLDIHEITDIPEPDLGASSLAVQAVKAGSRTMAERILELEVVTAKGTRK
jgi:uncharacterized membrane protein